MDELIKKTINKVQKNRDLYEKGKAEFAVRDHLINPILKQLGWDTSDPDFVIPNYRTGENDEPDYTLLKDGQVVTYIEAKKLTPNLIEHIGQLARYCTNQGIEYGILTDGIRWILLKSFEKGKTIHERIIWKIDLEDYKKEDIIAKLNTISYQNFDDLKELTRKLEVKDDIWESIINNPLAIENTIIEIMQKEMHKTDCEFEHSEIKEYVSRKLKGINKLFDVSTEIDKEEDTTFLLKTESSSQKKKAWSFETCIKRLNNQNTLIYKLYHYIKDKKTVSRERLEKFITTECRKSNGEFYSLSGTVNRSIESLEHYKYIIREDWISGKWNQIRILK
ncbi:MAG: hypothetical protein FVQ77_06435 [Cytophagales bacterium]|nr:hypothetical protein [Cytophagales bacterium]